MQILAESEQLRLITCNKEVIDAIISHSEELAVITGIHISPDWNFYSFPVFKLTQHCIYANPDCANWYTCLVVKKDTNVLIGCGGYKGKPNQDKAVEIYYEISPEYRNLGYGRMLASMLISNAFTYHQVSKIVAFTLPDNTDSIRILEFFGFQLVSESFHIDGSVVFRWELSKMRCKRLRVLY